MWNWRAWMVILAYVVSNKLVYVMCQLHMEDYKKHAHTHVWLFYNSFSNIQYDVSRRLSDSLYSYGHRSNEWALQTNALDYTGKKTSNWFHDYHFIWYLWRYEFEQFPVMLTRTGHARTRTRINITGKFHNRSDGQRLDHCLLGIIRST